MKCSFCKEEVDVREPHVLYYELKFCSLECSRTWWDKNNIEFDWNAAKKRHIEIHAKEARHETVRQVR